MKMWQKILLTIIVLIVISLLVFLYSKYIGAKMFYVKEYPLYSNGSILSSGLSLATAPSQ